MRSIYSVITSAGGTIGGCSIGPAEFAHYEEICAWLNIAYRDYIRRRFYAFGVIVLELTEEEATVLEKDNRIYSVTKSLPIAKALFQESPGWALEIGSGVNVGDGYSYRYTGKGIKVYVVDSGIELTHQEFEGRAVHGYDATVEAPLDPTKAADRTPIVSAHGTVVASAAGGKNVGVAKGVTLIDCKAGDADPTATPPSSFNSIELVECLNWIYTSRQANNDDSIAIINCSWGTTTADPTIEAALSTLISDGCIVVAGAGNNGNSVLFYPAAYDNVIAVGAIQEDLDIASFSNYGSYVDILAPGRFVNTATLSGKLVESSGTSVACSVVAGAAACIAEDMTGIDQVMFKKILFRWRQKNRSTHTRPSTTKDVVNINMVKTWYGNSGSVGGLKAIKNYTLKPFTQTIASPDSITYLPAENKTVTVVRRCPSLLRHGLDVEQNFATELDYIKLSMSSDITKE